MRLIDNDRIILLQRTIPLRLRQQDPVRHKFDLRLLRADLSKAHLPAHFLTDLHLQLLGNSPRHRGRRQSTRLRAANPPFSPHLPRELNRHLRQLRCLPRARLPHNDHNLRSPHGFENFFPPPRNRQVWISDVQRLFCSGGH